MCRRECPKVLLFLFFGSTGLPGIRSERKGLLVAEFTLVLGLRGLTIRGCLASRGPLSGTVYFVLLAIFALLPLLAARK